MKKIILSKGKYELIYCEVDMIIIKSFLLIQPIRMKIEDLLSQLEDIDDISNRIDKKEIIRGYYE